MTVSTLLSRSLISDFNSLLT
ncbi:hypothetical protein bpuSUM_001755 (plasmid) [Borrelia puertoricensis]|nr:hypothetical protein bpuSUM_001755 [Borrelia puertoricensis]